MLTRFERRVVIVSPDDDVAKAAHRMRGERVGSLVVVEQGRVVGILTDRDLVMRVLCERRDPETTPVRDVMTPSPVTVPVSAGITTVIDVMRKAGVRRLPVVSDDGQVRGIVTTDDLCAMLGRELGALGATLEEECDAPELR